MDSWFVNDNPVLLHDAKRVYVYGYGEDGRITVSKRLMDKGEIDLVEAIEGHDIEVQNSSDCEKTINISGIEIDENAFSAITFIMDKLNL